MNKIKRNDESDQPKETEAIKVENEDEDSNVGYIIYDCKVNREVNKNQFITEIVKLERVKQINEI